MHNVIIMGSGRSGTSMTAGILSNSGYFMGHKVLNKGRINNPFGNYEDQEINFLNEKLLEQVIPGPEIVDGVLQHRERPGDMQRWLGSLAPGTTVPAMSEYIPKIQELTGIRPYCFKDPRFSYTLPVWSPYLEDTVYVCVFRNPHKTVLSILKQIKDAPHLHGLEMDATSAMSVWTSMYSHILDIHRHSGDWLFLHYDQLLTDEGMDRLAAFTGAEVNRDFPKRGLRRDYPVMETSAAADRIYASLCELAGFTQ